MKFLDFLNDIGIKPQKYISLARRAALRTGYNPRLLFFSHNPRKKLNYDGIDFGANFYNDFIIYKLLNPEIADEKRRNYRARALQTAIDTDNKFSPANLSLNILWT